LTVVIPLFFFYFSILFFLFCSQRLFDVVHIFSALYLSGKLAVRGLAMGGSGIFFFYLFIYTIYTLVTLMILFSIL
jgi:hypothetical protein